MARLGTLPMATSWDEVDEVLVDYSNPIKMSSTPYQRIKKIIARGCQNFLVRLMLIIPLSGELPGKRRALVG